MWVLNFSDVFENFPTNLTIKKCFGMFGVFVKETVTFNIGFGFVVLDSIW